MNALLTDRQRDVLVEYAHHGSHVQVARCLEIAVQTSKNHTKDIYTRLGTHNMVETFTVLGWLRVPPHA